MKGKYDGNEHTPMLALNVSPLCFFTVIIHVLAACGLCYLIERPPNTCEHIGTTSGAGERVCTMSTGPLASDCQAVQLVNLLADFQCLCYYVFILLLVYF